MNLITSFDMNKSDAPKLGLVNNVRANSIMLCILRIVFSWFRGYSGTGLFAMYGSNSAINLRVYRFCVSFRKCYRRDVGNMWSIHWPDRLIITQYGIRKLGEIE